MQIEVYDIECLAGVFLYCGYNPADKTWAEFEISDYRNDLFALVKHLYNMSSKYSVSYNGLSYDAQILTYIIDNHQNWTEHYNDEIVTIIKKFSNKVIDDLKYELYPPYREEHFYAPQIDLMRTNHFDNENRRTSLKWLEFSMDFPNVEEMPFPHTQSKFTEEELAEVRSYCRNDVEATYTLWKYTTGDTEHKHYKGQNKIQDRLDMAEELGFPLKCLSWSDVKLGDEYNKKKYCELSGITEYQLRDIRRNRRSTKSFTYGDCIPNYIEFKTPEFRAFFEKMKKVKVNLVEKEEYPFSYNGTNYMIAKGGIHSNEKNRVIIPLQSEVLKDADIGSQYPWAIIKRGLFPAHLGKAWLIGFTETFHIRIGYKKEIKIHPKGSEKARKLTGLAETFKYSLNGGGFGKTNEKSNWQYDPFVTFNCTIGNQFEILMLIETLEISGIRVVSANTDGIVCLMDKTKEELYHKICEEWEKKVGNDINGKLEYADYQKLVQLSVNGYIAIKTDGEAKKKKEFVTDPELHKNKSRRIVALALEAYYKDEIPVEKTIKEHRNIYDFCIGVKGNKDYHHEAIDRDGKSVSYDKVVRYYVSKNGVKIMRVKNEGSLAPGPKITQCESGNWRVTIANKIENKDISEYDINYDYYIQNALDKINSLKKGRKTKGTTDNLNQLSMF